MLLTGCGTAGSAFASGAKGRGFKSRTGYQRISMLITQAKLETIELCSNQHTICWLNSSRLGDGDPCVLCQTMNLPRYWFLRYPNDAICYDAICFCQACLYVHIDKITSPNDF